MKKIAQNHRIQMTLLGKHKMRMNQCQYCYKLVCRKELPFCLFLFCLLPKNIYCKNSNHRKIQKVKHPTNPIKEAAITNRFYIF